MKKTLSVLLAVLMLTALCACGAKPAAAPAAPAEAAPAAPAEAAPAAPAEIETISLKVWGSQVDQELLKELCEACAAAHPENNYTVQ